MNLHEDFPDPLSFPDEKNGDCDFCGKHLSYYELHMATPYDFYIACEKHREFAPVLQKSIIQACMLVDPEITTLDAVNKMRLENKEPYKNALSKIVNLPRCQCCGQQIKYVDPGAAYQGTL